MKKRVILAITLAAIVSATAMVGCTTKSGSGSSSSSTPSSQAPSSEAPKKAAAGQLTTVFDTVYKAAFAEEGPSMEPITDIAQIKELTGVELTADLAKNAIYAIPMMNTQFQKFLGIEVADGKAADVEKLLKDYQTKVIADQEAFPYVDSTVEKAKGAQIVTVDNYVFYICMANTAEMGDEPTVESVTAETKKLADAAKEAVKYE